MKTCCLYATLASREEDKDTIDSAIIDKAKTFSAIKEKIKSYKVSNYKPFDPVVKRTEATIEDSIRKTNESQ